jgi:hypothetical protein
MAGNPKRWNKSKGTTIEGAKVIFAEECATVYYFFGVGCCRWCFGSNIGFFFYFSNKNNLMTFVLTLWLLRISAVNVLEMKDASVW